MTRPGRTSRSAVATRSTYTRSTGDILTNDPEGWMSDGMHGPVWWLGLDSGGGRYPIGPNGPNSTPALPVVIRATSLITGPLTASPFRVLEGGYGGRPLGRPRWITDPQLTRADLRVGVQALPAVLRLARSVFWTDWIRSACWYGMGGLLFQVAGRPDPLGDDSSRNPAPIAGTLHVVNPRVLTTRRVDGSLRWVIETDDPYDVDGDAVFDRDGYLQLGGLTYRLIVLRNPHSPIDEDGISQGVFAMTPSAFRLGRQVDEYASGTFRSGVPAGYLKVETPGLTQPQASELKQKWMAAHGGDRRSIAVLNSTTSFSPLSLSPIDAALGEVKRLSIADVAFAFGLSPTTLDVSLANSATYVNVQESWQNHKDFGLSPWIAAVQDTLSMLLPGTQGIVIDLDSIATTDPAKRYAAYASALASGILTINEVRELEGLPPLDDSDQPVDEPSDDLEAVDDSDVPEELRHARPSSDVFRLRREERV